MAFVEEDIPADYKAPLTIRVVAGYDWSRTVPVPKENSQ